MIAVAARPSMFSPAAALGLKLYALAAMVVDHVDWMLLDGRLGFHDTWGRTVFPVFAVLLAANLARWGRPDHMLHGIAWRMLVVGMVACWPYIALRGDLLPLNVMFTLSAAVALCALVQLRMYLFAALFGLIVGAFVDYGWFGLLAVLLPWAALRAGALPSVALGVACLLLYPINGNLWALAAVPLVAIASYFDGDAPRLKWLFYVGYPAHLVAIAAIERFQNGTMTF